MARCLPESVGFTHVFIVTLLFILASFVTGCHCERSEAISEGEIASAASQPRNDSVANIFLLLSVSSFAALLYINFNIYPNNHISHFLGEEKLKTNIVGIIKSPALTRKPYYGKINSTYLFEAEQIGDRGVTGLAQMRIQTEKEYGYGDRLLVRGTIRRPADDTSRLRSLCSLRSKNIVRARPRRRRAESRTFNYREYLERQNIFALINTKEHSVTILSHDYKSNPILKYIYFLREKLKNQVIDKMPLETGAFLRAILLGDRSELPKHIQNSFKKSGTMHILPTQCRGKYNYTPKSNLTLYKSIS